MNQFFRNAFEYLGMIGKWIVKRIIIKRFVRIKAY